MTGRVSSEARCTSVERSNGGSISDELNIKIDNTPDVETNGLGNF